MDASIEAARFKAKVFLALWLVLFVPWLPFAALSGMAFDGGYTPQAYTFIWSIWTYPVLVAIAAIFRNRIPALALLPLLNVTAFILCILAR